MHFHWGLLKGRLSLIMTTTQRGKWEAHSRSEWKMPSPDQEVEVTFLAGLQVSPWCSLKNTGPLWELDGKSWSGLPSRVHFCFLKLAWKASSREPSPERSLCTVFPCHREPRDPSHPPHYQWEEVRGHCPGREGEDGSSPGRSVRARVPAPRECVRCYSSAALDARTLWCFD